MLLIMEGSTQSRHGFLFFLFKQMALKILRLMFFFFFALTTRSHLFQSFWSQTKAHLLTKSNNFHLQLFFLSPTSLHVWTL